MNKLIAGLLLSSFFFGSSYYGSTTAPVTLAGAIIKARTVENIKKYNRKDCPVCEGKGWYMSGDNIKRVDCGYCEAEKELISIDSIKPINSTIIKPKLKPKNDCINGQCPLK